MAKWLLSEVHERLEPRVLIGCGAGGTVAAGRELEDTPGIVVWGASLPGAELETMHLTAERDAEGFRLLGLPESLSETTGDEPAADESLLALCDPFSFPAGGAARGTRALAARTCRCWAGSPAPRSPAARSCCATARSTPTARSPCGCAELEVLPCVSQGAGPVGPEMTITGAEANVIGQLAGKPAMERLGEVIAALPEHERELAASGVLIGLVIDENRPEYERGDFLVRPIIGADRESGAIAIGEPVRVGQTVRLHVRDAASADEDLREALRAQAEALGSDGAAGALAVHLQRPRLATCSSCPTTTPPRSRTRSARRPPASSAPERSARSAVATSCTASPRRWRCSRRDPGHRVKLQGHLPT